MLPFSPPTPNSCKNCASGYYRSSAWSQSACPPGWYCPGSCSAYECGPGSYQDQYGMTTCKSCPSYTYQDQYGQSGCKSCSPGYYSLSSGTGEALCNPGYACSSCQQYSCSQGYNYQDQYGQSYCKGVTYCTYGQYFIQSAITTRNTLCGSCSLNVNYMDVYSHTYASCKPLTACQPGQYISTAASLSTNR